jgi:hypothetical protein
VGHPMKGPPLGTNPAIDREEVKVDKMINSICRGCRSCGLGGICRRIASLDQLHTHFDGAATSNQNRSCGGQSPESRRMKRPHSNTFLELTRSTGHRNVWPPEFRKGLLSLNSRRFRS